MSLRTRYILVALKRDKILQEKAGHFKLSLDTAIAVSIMDSVLEAA